MKTVIFEPHPDDLLFGAGPVIFDWIKEGYNIHIITVTDGRACFRGDKHINMTEEDVAEIRLNEARDTIKFLRIPQYNLHLLKFRDAEARNHVDEGIELVKDIIKDANRILIPSNNNGNQDHQATHNIAIGASKELNLDIEYWVYFIPSYGRFKEDSREKQIEIEITDDLRLKLQKWLQSQQISKFTRKFYSRYLDDIGKYYNF